MPQMSPMWWFTLFIMFIMSLMMTSMLTFFNFMIKKEKSILKTKMISKKTNWKW
uniref:ATP synthase complex subunit 8 n=1 Tax=Ochterus marginatus TaxID=280162 RepID=C5HIV5_9HEMI|nr:ATP synthase F0 subunit 8 [Ochterus marginatus]